LIPSTHPFFVRCVTYFTFTHCSSVAYLNPYFTRLEARADRRNSLGTIPKALQERFSQWNSPSTRLAISTSHPKKNKGAVAGHGPVCSVTQCDVKSFRVGVCFRCCFVVVHVRCIRSGTQCHAISCCFCMLVFIVVLVLRYVVERHVTPFVCFAPRRVHEFQISLQNMYCNSTLIAFTNLTFNHFVLSAYANLTFDQCAM
jgi:hypothetical protein